MQFDWRCQEGDQTEKRDRRRASFLLRKPKRPWSWEIVMGWKTGNALAIDTSVCFLETSSSISRFCYFHAWRNSISPSLRLSHIVSLPTSCLPPVYPLSTCCLPPVYSTRLNHWISRHRKSCPFWEAAAYGNVKVHGYFMLLWKVIASERNRIWI